MNFSKFWTFLIIATFFYVACAQKRLPPGGPTDVTPPSILELFPDTINTNIQKLLTIRIKFDEMVNQGSFQSALRIIPPNYEFEINWLDFDEVELIPADPDSQLTETVIVFIGRELTDLRKNGLKMSIDLIFTPYDSIPSGQISGKIYGIENKKELQVWAVTFNDSTANSPLRIADIEDENQYLLKYLKDPHLYLPVIIEDRGKKFTIEKDDKIFLPYKNSAHKEFNFWQPVSKDSFIMPGISKFLLVKQNVLSWQLERPDPSINFRFLVNNEYTEPLFIYQDPQKPATYFAWWDSLAAEELEIVWYRDSIKSADRQLVDLSEEMESIIFSMKIQGINEPLLPNDTLTFISSVPIEPNDIDQLFFSGNIEGKVNFTSPIKFEVFPIHKWPMNEIISIEFKYHPLDTILNFNFETFGCKIFITCSMS